MTNPLRRYRPEPRPGPAPAQQVEPTAESLAAVGVELAPGHDRTVFRCRSCGREWWCGFRLVPGGIEFLPVDGWWRCPEGCNARGGQRVLGLGGLAPPG